MGLYQPEGLVAKPPRNQVENPRAKGLIPTAKTFREAVDYLLVDPVPGEGLWCDDRTWTDRTVHRDFRAHELIGLCGVFHLSSQLVHGSYMLRV